MHATLELSFGDKTLTLETGRVARQAHGSVVARMAESVVLATCVGDTSPRPGIGFFPLTVEFRNLAAASGRIPGGYGRREGRLSVVETLASRVIDRALRPLFPDGYRCEVQVVAKVLSGDPEGDPAMLAANAAAAAVALSDLPWGGPVCFARVAQLGGRWIVFPSPEERALADLDLAVASSLDGLVMLEGSARQVSEADFLEALDEVERILRPNLEQLVAWRAKVGRPARAWDAPVGLSAEGMEKIGSHAERMQSALATPGKHARKAALSALKKEVLAGFPDEERGLAAEGFSRWTKKLIRAQTLGDKRRIDGRALDEVRPISAEAGWLPRAHGSSLFTRGETQAIVTCTLGGPGDALTEDTLFGRERRRFFLHYNFPSYSVGEIRPMRGPGRREIGHGTLAATALQPVMPADGDFPYVVRVVSEISESNGSSSMASVCGGSLAMMDAGVPIAAPVAGIAMGLMKEGEEVAILSDILGDEDHVGDMDFKVAGTAHGITAVQMDNKLGSLPREILEQAMEQARRGRLEILETMAGALAKPRAETSSHAPMLTSVKIRPNRIRTLVGPRGAHLKEIEAQTGVRVEVDDSGLVTLSAPEAESGRRARAMVLDWAGEVELDRIYAGTITSVKDFGCFVRIFEGIEGMVHVSELEGPVKAGETLNVKVVGVDHAGRLRVSHRDARGAVAGGV